MRYVAAYLLAVLGGNANPSGDDIKSILGSVGIEANNDCLNKVIGELNGKDVNQVINAGLFKLASMPAGGGAVAAPTAAAAVEIEAPAAVEEKEETKVVSDESDDDMGFGLFD